ncbi:hypothetical protein D3C77_315660 [compost metagenome]
MSPSHEVANLVGFLFENIDASVREYAKIEGSHRFGVKSARIIGECLKRSA